MAFDLSAETLDCTWLSELRPGSKVNLERAARLDTRLGGHLVSGHVDGVGTVLRVEERGDGGWEMHFEVPEGFERYLIEKGSITVDGVSLTVVAPRGREFHVALIPETLRRTTLGLAHAGTRVHLEADQLGKWIERLLEARR
jgi:riboflavin synthase